MTILAYLALGACAGLLAGLLGVGGGLIIVPALVLLFNLQGFPDQTLVHMAIGTSLATIVVTSLSSIRAHHGRDAVHWPVFRALTPGIVVGALAGAGLADLLPAQVLRSFFGVFAMFAALRMAWITQPPPHRTLPGRPALAAGGVVIGTISAIVGIGGGTMTVPYLNWANVPMVKAVGTSAACGLPIAIAGAFGYVLTGWHADHLPAYASGYVYWPAFAAIVSTSVLTAPLGAKLAHSLPTAALKRVFAGFLLLVGLRMMW